VLKAVVSPAIQFIIMNFCLQKQTLPARRPKSVREDGSQSQRNLSSLHKVEAVLCTEGNEVERVGKGQGNFFLEEAGFGRINWSLSARKRD
jgi:hypothetical protein